MCCWTFSRNVNRITPLQTESEYRPSLGVPAMHEVCGGAEPIHPRVETDLHGDGHPDAGGRVLNAGAVRQEGFQITAVESKLAQAAAGCTFHR